MKGIYSILLRECSTNMVLHLLWENRESTEFKTNHTVSKSASVLVSSTLICKLCCFCW